MKMSIQNGIRENYRKAGQITNILMDDKLTIAKAQELRKTKDDCFKRIDFYKKLSKAMNKEKVGV